MTFVVGLRGLLLKPPLQTIRSNSNASGNAMTASAVQLAKRALVSLLLALARQYGIALAFNRDSPDKSVLDGFRKVIRKAHPDKGGSLQHTQQLNMAREKRVFRPSSLRLLAFRSEGTHPWTEHRAKTSIHE